MHACVRACMRDAATVAGAVARARRIRPAPQRGMSGSERGRAAGERPPRAGGRSVASRGAAGRRGRGCVGNGARAAARHISPRPLVTGAGRSAASSSLATCLWRRLTATALLSDRAAGRGRGEPRAASVRVLRSARAKTTTSSPKRRGGGRPLAMQRRSVASSAPLLLLLLLLLALERACDVAANATCRATGNNYTVRRRATRACTRPAANGGGCLRAVAARAGRVHGGGGASVPGRAVLRAAGEARRALPGELHLPAHAGLRRIPLWLAAAALQERLLRGLPHLRPRRYHHRGR
eukprot:scaffold1334_cov344-Prasinococcus_capsulatus_cf.AAC.10